MGGIAVIAGIVGIVGGVARSLSWSRFRRARES
jgi:hypothetical protein